MDELLRPVSSTRRSLITEPAQLLEVKGAEKTAKARQQFKATSVEEALECLKNEPDYETLVSTLRYLLSGPKEFAIGSPSPLAAQIVLVLVSSILPNYWAVLKEDSTADERPGENKAADLQLLLRCLCSLTGLRASLSRLGSLIAESKLDQGRATDSAIELSILLEMLSSMLEGHASIQRLWSMTAAHSEDVTIRKSLSTGLVSVLGGGRVISLAAEAESIVSKGPRNKRQFWIADSKQYSAWLAMNVVDWASQDPSTEDMKHCSSLFTKAMRLGHPDIAVQRLVTGIFLDPKVPAPAFGKMLAQLSPLEQKSIIFSILKYLSETYLGAVDKGEAGVNKEHVPAVAGLIESMIGENHIYQEFLVSWLLSTAGIDSSRGVGIRRAVLAVVSRDKASMSIVLEKTVEEFGDQLYIKHTPILQQEAQTQTLLLTAGYVHRLAPLKLVLQMRSSAYLRAISNRLAASQNRAKFLGMVVGEALSGLTDTGAKKLDFHMEELDSPEANWYKGLVAVSDRVGSVAPLRKPEKSAETQSEAKSRTLPNKPAPKPRPPPAPRAQGFVIEEVEEDDEEEDADLVPYAKPDSDDEDSDDDPETIRRDKPRAPVYIRDLIVYFRDTENYDKQSLALVTAPVLIRRKANYGTEVKEHTEDLASLLVGLQDTFELDDFYNQRLQGMIALVVAQPEKMGQWFARTFFEGDYSITQRASVLTVLGLSARELAGFDVSEYTTAAAFPSKLLPEKMEHLYLEASSSNDKLPSSSLKALPPSALDSIAKSLTSNFLASMAANAADAVTGPDVLKLSSFTSRLQDKNSAVSKSKSKPKSGVRTIPNTTAKLISTSFVYPLTARFQAAAQTPSARTRGVLFQPFLLSLFLKTLAVLVHAAGPSTLALPDMTAELWALLLGASVQAQCAGDVAVTHAVLFALAALLEVNEARMRDVCRDMAREVVQTQEWVGRVFEGTRGGEGSGQEGEVRMLAAGVLIRLQEGMEKYRALLMGEMIG